MSYKGCQALVIRLSAINKSMNVACGREPVLRASGMACPPGSLRSILFRRVVGVKLTAANLR